MAKEDPAIVRLVEARPKLPKTVALAYLSLRTWCTENGYRLALYKVKK